MTITINTIAGDDTINGAESINGVTIGGGINTANSVGPLATSVNVDIVVDDHVFSADTVVLSFTVPVSGGVWALSAAQAAQVAALGDAINYYVRASASNQFFSSTHDFTINRFVSANFDASITGVSDNVAPVQGPVSSGSSTDDTSPTISGTVSGGNGANGSVIAIFDNGVYLGQTTATFSGSATTWSFTPSALSLGSHNFTAARIVGAQFGDQSGAYGVNIIAPPVNTAPVGVADSYSVDEDASLTTTTANGVLKNDTDAQNNSLTASVVTGPAHGTLNLAANGTFTYTPFANYSGSDSFTYKANDGSLDSGVTTVSITVNALNDAPTNITLSANTVAENSADGTVIGTLSTADVDTSDTHTYTITSGGDAFAIVGGSLVAKAGIDFEAGSTRSVTVVSTDSGTGHLTTSQTFTITVTDVNDNAPVFTSTAAPSVAENTKAVVTLTTTDADSVGSPVTYTVTGGADAAKFTIVGGQLQFVDAPNYEGQPHSYSVQVTANDGANNTVQSLTVSVTDLNDTAPVFTSTATPSVAENTKAVVTLASTDADTVGGPVTYSITGGADAAKFAIVGGQLQFVDAPNYEGQPHSYSVQVTANDGANNTAQDLTVSVTDVNDNAPVFTSTAAPSVAENTKAVVTLASTDADTVGGPVTYSITGGADAAKFAIVGGQLQFVDAPNYEGQPHSYSVQVTANDGANSTAQNLTVSVTDVNDNAPVFTSTAAPSVAENTKAVVDLTSTDVDTVGGPVTYAITGGADAAKFVIVGGQLQFVSAPDYETQAHSYAVQVTANDGANTTVQNLTVALTDTNDVTPVITSGSAVNFAENGAGTVYTATSTDGDSSAAFRNVSYSLAAGGDNNLFNINSTTGALTFKAAPNFEAPQDSDKNNSYVLTVQAFDGVNTGTKTVTVNVTDLVEDSGPANTAGLTITSANATINDATPLITGVASTAQAGQTVTLFEGTTARGTGVVQTNGTWSIESTNVGADGAHSFTAQLGSSVSNSVTLNIDTVAPVVTITGTTGTGFSPTVNGTASVSDIGRTVAILDGTSVVGSGTVGAGGAFSVTTGLTGTGPHGLTARVVDLAGNVGTSAVNTYTIAPQPAQGQIDSDNLDAAYLNIMDAASLRAGDKDFMLDLKTKLSVNLVTYKQALDAVIDRADGSTSVATLSYQFFTGKIPTKAGLDYLVSETGGNANNLNSAYYQNFNIENRFINFAVNLGHDGAGKDAFQTKYGALSLFDATKKAYTEIFGTAATDTKVHELLDTTMSFGGKTITRADYFANYGHDAIGTKAAMVGWLLSEAAKADVGTYATANEAFLSDLADGATFNVDLIGTYGAKAIPLEVLG